MSALQRVSQGHPLPADAGPRTFLEDVFEGLGSSPKRLPSKYLYDRNGSMLFEAVCDLPEYYITRTERAILERYAPQIADRACEGAAACCVIEPGAGSGTKTRLLLRALGARCAEYIPVDISGAQLAAAAEELRSELAWLRVTPLEADFTVELPGPTSRDRAGRNVVFFPGSTIGNFDPEEASALLARFRRAAGPDGVVLLGVDLKKRPEELHAAYNDAQGVTASFNKNLLQRINDELGADFDLASFEHYAFYAPVPGRIEMHLVSARRQVVRVGGRAFSFEEGESICTEHSYKYDACTIERLARASGLRLIERWSDDERRFAMLLFRAGGS